MKLIKILSGFILVVASLVVMTQFSSLSVAETLLQWFIPVPSVSVEELKNHAKEEDTPALIIDVRSAEEYQISHIPVSIHFSSETPADSFIHPRASGVKW